jgi:hypothetical protein
MQQCANNTRKASDSQNYFTRFGMMCQALEREFYANIMRANEYRKILVQLMIL